ncbi:MAG: hypothetical protein PHX27_04280 [Candidatus ainarchaeum sp.]|nr:hypothetical protein [Candidatus ainarchaeum sp.]
MKKILILIIFVFLVSLNYSQSFEIDTQGIVIQGQYNTTNYECPYQYLQEGICIQTDFNYSDIYCEGIYIDGICLKVKTTFFRIDSCQACSFCTTNPLFFGISSCNETFCNGLPACYYSSGKCLPKPEVCTGNCGDNEFNKYLEECDSTTGTHNCNPPGTINACKCINGFIPELDDNNLPTGNCIINNDDPDAELCTIEDECRIKEDCNPNEECVNCKCTPITPLCSCGIAAKNYFLNEEFPQGTFCNSECSLNPKNPILKNYSGAKINWTCELNDSSINCQANRLDSKVTCPPDSECTIDSDCISTQFCFNCECLETPTNNTIISINSKYNKNSKEFIIDNLCKNTSKAIIKIFSPENKELIEINSFCTSNTPYSQKIFLPDINSGLYLIIVEIPTPCEICKRESFSQVNILKEEPFAIPDNNFFIIIIFITSICFILKTKK